LVSEHSGPVLGLDALDVVAFSSQHRAIATVIVLSLLGVSARLARSIESDGWPIWMAGTKRLNSALRRRVALSWARKRLSAP